MAVHKKYNNGTKSNALGRGLDALISTEGVRTQGSSTINEIPLDQIEANPNQPRREFDDEALYELAESIKAIGIIQPITLRQVSENRFQIIAGERRWRASQLAGLTAIPAYIRTISDELGELYKRLESIRCEVYDLAETIRDKRAEFAFSPAELDAAEARTDQLYRLKKKYGATVEDMIAYLEQCRSELDAMETADDTLILLNGKLKKAEAVVRAVGAELTQKRKAAAQALEQRIQSELRDLDMNKVRFAIEFTEKEPAADGCDVIRFLMSANAGEDLRPIAKIASGGELARIMLALKNVLAEQESIATLVFDEVDTGVSGRAAQKVAEKLTQVAQRKQVLCVTHLPQLAAMADTHFSVEKGESGGRTFTRVIQLDREARKAELARITGGSQVTPALLESAGELLDQADAYRKQHFV